MSDIIMNLLNAIISLGYFGVAIALMIEIIPSELVLAYGGFMVSQGDLNFAIVVVAGTIGITIAQIILYWIGYYGGRPFLNKYGKFLLIHSNHLDLTEKWFQKYGAGVVFFARFIPIIRQAISIPAGIAKMPMGKFLFYTILATIPWAILFIYLGEQLGQNWDQIKEITAPYVDTVAIIIIIVFALYIVFKLSRRKYKP